MEFIFVHGADFDGRFCFSQSDLIEFVAMVGRDTDAKEIIADYYTIPHFVKPGQECALQWFSESQPTPKLSLRLRPFDALDRIARYQKF